MSEPESDPRFRTSEAYRETRTRFDSLRLDEQAVFLVDALLATVGHGINEAGRGLDDLMRETRDAAERVAREVDVAARKAADRAREAAADVTATAADAAATVADRAEDVARRASAAATRTAREAEETVDPSHPSGSSDTDVTGGGAFRTPGAAEGATDPDASDPFSPDVRP